MCSGLWAGKDLQALGGAIEKGLELFAILRIDAIMEVGGMESLSSRAMTTKGYDLSPVFKSPISDIKQFLKNSGVESFTFIEGTNAAKTAIIGQGMERVKIVANGLKNPEIFKPSEAAIKEWDQLVNSSGGAKISDVDVMKTLIYKENMQWIEGVKKAGYNILDIRGGSSSTFYNMEKEKVYGANKK